VTIDPVSTELARNWPAQNAHNLDFFDTATGSPLVQTYNPSLSGTVTSPNLGAGGTATGTYFRLLDVVWVWVDFIFSGAGVDEGEGLYVVNLPVPANLSLAIIDNAGRGTIIGSGQLFDSSASSNRQTCAVQLREQSQVYFPREALNATRVIDHDTPFVWADSDRLSFSARYPV
jgi:hypothetical protein